MFPCRHMCLDVNRDSAKNVLVAELSSWNDNEGHIDPLIIMSYGVAG